MIKTKTVRVTVTLPQDLCDELDQIAKDNLVSRSYLIKISVQNYLDSLEEEENE